MCSRLPQATVRGVEKRGGPKIQQRLSLRQAALKGKKNEVGAAANPEFVEQVRNVKLHGALRNVELAGNFFVRKILQQRVENFLLAAAQIGDGIGLQAAALAGEDGINESREKLARNPESSTGNERESADQLFAGFDIGEKALHAKTQERKTVGFVVLLADDDEPGFRMALHKIGQERAGGRLRGMRVNDVNLSFGRLQGAQIGRERGLQLLEGNLELGFCQNAFEFAQHQRRSEEHTSELQSQSNLVCRLLLEKKKKKNNQNRQLIIISKYTSIIHSS